MNCNMVIERDISKKYRQLDPRRKIEVYAYALILRKKFGYKRIKTFIEKKFDIKIGLTTIRNWFSKRMATPLNLGPIIMDIIEMNKSNIKNNGALRENIEYKKFYELDPDERLNIYNEALKLCTEGYGPYLVRKALELKYNVDIPRGAIAGWVYRGNFPQGRKQTNLTVSPPLSTVASISVSDGGISNGRRKKLKVEMKDKRPIEVFIENMKKITGRLDYRIGYNSKKGTFYTQVYRADLINFFNSEENIITLLQSYPKEFISSYFDCEGCPCGYITLDNKSGKLRFEGIIVVTNTNERILDVFREELRKMGIHSSKRLLIKRGRKSIIRGREIVSKKDCYALLIFRKDAINKFHREIGFISQRKQEKLNDIVRILNKFQTKERRAIEWIRLYEYRGRGREKWVKRKNPISLKKAKKIAEEIKRKKTPHLLSSFPPKIQHYRWT